MITAPRVSPPWFAQPCGAFGEYEDAERWFVRATTTVTCQDHGRVWILPGANLARLNQLDDAAACHRRAPELPNADYDEAHVNLGLIARAQGRYNDATAAF